MKKKNLTKPRQSWTFDEYTNSEIRRAAETGIYDIRGGGSKRKLPHFDDLLFLGLFANTLKTNTVLDGVNSSVEEVYFLTFNIPF